MSFSFDSKSNSSSNLEISSDTSCYVRKINSINDLEKLIENAKSNGLKRITVKDSNSSFLNVEIKDLFGNSVNISPFPSRNSTFVIEFI